MAVPAGEGRGSARPAVAAALGALAAWELVAMAPAPDLVALRLLAATLGLYGGVFLAIVAVSAVLQWASALVFRGRTVSPPSRRAVELFVTGTVIGLGHGWPVVKAVLAPTLGRSAALGLFVLVLVLTIVGLRRLSGSAVELALSLAAAGAAGLGVYLLRAEPLGVPAPHGSVAAASTAGLALAVALALRRPRGRVALLIGALALHALAVRWAATSPHGVLMPSAGESTATAADNTSDRGAGTPRARPPLALLLVVDTLRADAIDPTGERTPGLAALAADSDRFTNAIANGSWTIPGHASLLTGLRVAAHRVDMTSTPGFGARLGPAIPTLHERFAAAGYETSCVSANGIVGPGSGLVRGCDRYRHPGRVWTLQTLPLRFWYAVSPSARPALEEQFLVDLFGLRRHASAGRVLDLALAEIDRGAEPRYLFANLMDVHKAYPSRLSALDRWRFRRDLVAAMLGLKGPEAFDRTWAGAMRRDYDAEVEALDAALGGFFDALRERDLYDPALVVLTSDHGEAFYENEERPLYYDHHGAWETAVRIPLLVKRPTGDGEAAPRGRRFDHRVEQADLAAAVLALAGIDPLPEAGATLALYDETPRPAVTEWNPHPIPGAMSTLASPRVGLYHGPYKLVLEGPWRDPGAPVERTLFDLETAPYETADLSATHTDLAEALTRKLLATVEATEHGALTATAEEPDPDLLRNLRSLGYID